MTTAKTPEELAERVFRRDIGELLPEWAMQLGPAWTTVEGHRVIPVKLQRGGFELHVDAYVWSGSPLGQMDAETSVAIAISSVIEKVDASAL